MSLILILVQIVLNAEHSLTSLFYCQGSSGDDFNYSYHNCQPPQKRWTHQAMMRILKNHLGCQVSMHYYIVCPLSDYDIVLLLQFVFFLFKSQRLIPQRRGNIRCQRRRGLLPDALGYPTSPPLLKKTMPPLP